MHGEPQHCGKAAADGRGRVVMGGSHKQRKMASTEALRDFPCGRGGDDTYLLLLSAAWAYIFTAAERCLRGH